MDKITTIRTIETKHFIFELDALVEDESPTSIFGDMEHIKEEEKAIEEGRAVYFCARARIKEKKFGTVLAEDYLGACSYESYDSFRRDPYATDMTREVVQKAREELETETDRAKGRALHFALLTGRYGINGLKENARELRESLEGIK